MEKMDNHNRIQLPAQWTKNIWILGIQEMPYYLVVGKENSAIIEGGISALVPKVLRDYESLDLKSELKYLIVMHTHTDHVTGLIKLKRSMPRLNLVGSKETADILRKEKILARFALEDLGYGTYFAGKGLIDSPPEMLAADPVEVDLTVEDGDSIDLGGVQIRFIDAPGHAPGNLAVEIMPDNALLISDAAGYIESIDDICPLFFHNFQRYTESLEKLSKYEPEHLGLGHNFTISGKENIKDFFNRALKDAWTLKNDICSKLDDGIPKEKVVLDFAKRLSGYGLFGIAHEEVQIGYGELIVRRALGE